MKPRDSITRRGRNGEEKQRERAIIMNAINPGGPKVRSALSHTRERDAFWRNLSTDGIQKESYEIPGA